MIIKLFFLLYCTLEKLQERNVVAGNEMTLIANLVAVVAIGGGGAEEWD